MKVYFYILIMALVTSCNENSMKEKVEVKSELPPLKTFENIDQILNYTLKCDTVRINQGDTLEFITGRLFNNKKKHLILAFIDPSQAVNYSVYELKNNRWKLLNSIKEEYNYIIQFSLEDYNFDGYNDFAFCASTNVNGNCWHKLFLNLDDSLIYISNFNVSHPEIDKVNKTIRGRTLSGMYDEQEKFIGKFVDTNFIIMEMVTSVYEIDGDKERQNICYLKRVNNKLEKQYCEYDNDSLWNKLVYQE